MWLFTKYGFYSAVRSSLDPSMTAVRSRERAHLEKIKTLLPDLLGKYEILEFAKTDYQYRIIVPNSAWALAAATITSDIDYTNFKAHVMREESKASEAYCNALHDVWEAVFDNYFETKRVIECSICHEDIPVVLDWAFGNNAQPVNDGRCCNRCNMEVVIPARLQEISKRSGVRQ